VQSQPIGIFDSGIGGLTVARQFRRVLPAEDLLYLGDTARVPYGTKSPETVVRYACEDTAFLASRGVKAVVVACNTASAWALETLQKRFSIPIFGVIAPGADAAVASTRTARIGVIGTPATIRSGAYARAVLARRADAQVFARACPLLVPLVEEGWENHAVSAAILEEYLRPLLRRRIDTLVLGCTHYPLLKRAIRRVTGPRVALIDSAETCARHLAAELARLDLLAQRRRPGKFRACLTDETARFAQIARHFFGQSIDTAEKVELPVLED
jgi:glutamate racemase